MMRVAMLRLLRHVLRQLLRQRHVLRHVLPRVLRQWALTVFSAACACPVSSAV